MTLWMMSEPEVATLYADFEKAQASGSAPLAMAETVVRSSESSIMKLRGPLVARTNMMTEYFGMTTTEQHMANFIALRDEGKKIFLDIDGPGGQVPLMFEFAEMIHAAGDQVTAYTGGYAASAHMLLFCAAKTRLAHHSATLGSIGVMSYWGGTDPNVVISDNAANKMPSKEVVQVRVNEQANKFVATLSTFTGMDQNAIVSSGGNGGVFDGDKALASGFVTKLSDSESAFAISKTVSTIEKSSMTPDEHKTAVDTAVAKNNERWELMLAHENSANHEAVAEIAKLPISTDQALAQMKHVKVEKAEAVIAPVVVPTAAVVTPETPAPAVVTPTAGTVDAPSIALVLANLLATASTKVPGSSSDEEGEEEAPKVSDEDQGAQAASKYLGLKA